MMQRSILRLLLVLVFVTGLVATPAGNARQITYAAPTMQAGSFTTEAIDLDPDNQLAYCDAAGPHVPMGDKSVDVGRCVSFRYPVPPGGINSATLHLAVEQLSANPETDAMGMAVAPDFDLGGYSWLKGKMSGAVLLHGGFFAAQPSLDLDLFNLACDPSIKDSITPEMQQAVIDQVRTGVVHVTLSDDTTVYRGQMVINGGPLTVACGQSAREGTPGTGEGANAGAGGPTIGGGGAGSGSGAGGSTIPTPPFGTNEPANLPGLIIQAGQRRVLAGAYVEVPVYLINSGDVANMNFTVQYDSNVAVIEGDVSGGPFVSDRLFEANTGASGLVSSGFAGTKGLQGTGVITYLPFRAVGQPGDRTELRLAVSTINDPGGTLLSIDRIFGAIEIVDTLGPGDCDGDGRLRTADAVCALRISVGLLPENAALDLDTSGGVTSRDATIIQQRSLVGGS